MNIFNFLQTEETFTFNEQIIVDYLLAYPEDVLHQSIYTLAKNTNSSTSTIVRLCQKMGLSGFKEFKIIFAREVEARYQTITNIDANTPFESRDTDLMISKKIAQLTEETVSATQQLLTTQKLNHTVDLLLQAQTIFTIGVSDNYIRLHDFQLKLLRIGKFVHLIDLQAEQYHLATNAQKTDVALLISYSGKTAEVVNDAKVFFRKGTPIIAITSDLSSPLANYATEVLLLPNKEASQFKVSNFSSQLAIEYLLNVLYSCIFTRNYEQNYSEQRQTPTSKFEF